MRSLSRPQFNQSELDFYLWRSLPKKKMVFKKFNGNISLQKKKYLWPHCEPFSLGLFLWKRERVPVKTVDSIYSRFFQSDGDTDSENMCNCLLYLFSCPLNSIHLKWSQCIHYLYSPESRICLIYSLDPQFRWGKKLNLFKLLGNTSSRTQQHAHSIVLYIWSRR